MSASIEHLFEYWQMDAASRKYLGMFSAVNVAHWPKKSCVTNSLKWLANFSHSPAVVFTNGAFCFFQRLSRLLHDMLLLLLGSQFYSEK
jgi:hypothetical protein